MQRRRQLVAGELLRAPPLWWSRANIRDLGELFAVRERFCLHTLPLSSRDTRSQLKLSPVGCVWLSAQVTGTTLAPPRPCPLHPAEICRRHIMN